MDWIMAHDPNFPKGYRIGCPNGHNSIHTIYGHNFHRCGLCGADHTWTKSAEESVEPFGSWLKEAARQIKC